MCRAAFVPRPAPLAVVDPGAELGLHFLAGLETSHNPTVRRRWGATSFSVEPAGPGPLRSVTATSSRPVTYRAPPSTTQSNRRLRSAVFESLNQFFTGDHGDPSLDLRPVFGTFHH